MTFHRPRRGRVARFAAISSGIFSLLLAGDLLSAAQERDTAPTRACADDNGGITLPLGFCATVFADNIGHARQLVVAPNGVVYVNTWSGTYYGNDTPPPGGFLVALQDTHGTGRADVNVRFGETREQGSAGGTGIALYDGGLFAEVNDRIVRYALPTGTIAPSGPPETIISGLPLTGDHPMHPFRIDQHGALYVDVASATNACQVANRTFNSPGIQPCTELETRAGIWRYDANRTVQQFSPAERFVTGLRNGEGIVFDAAGRIFSTQHGRDDLRENWPSPYTQEQGAGEPAEEVVQLERSADYGWPECYFDLAQQKLVLGTQARGSETKRVNPTLAIFALRSPRGRSVVLRVSVSARVARDRRASALSSPAEPASDGPSMGAWTMKARLPTAQLEVGPRKPGETCRQRADVRRLNRKSAFPALDAG